MALAKMRDGSEDRHRDHTEEATPEDYRLTSANCPVSRRFIGMRYQCESMSIDVCIYIYMLVWKRCWIHQLMSLQHTQHPQFLQHRRPLGTSSSSAEEGSRASKNRKMIDMMIALWDRIPDHSGSQTSCRCYDAQLTLDPRHSPRHEGLVIHLNLGTAEWWKPRNHINYSKWMSNMALAAICCILLQSLLAALEHTRIPKFQPGTTHLAQKGWPRVARLWPAQCPGLDKRCWKSRIEFSNRGRGGWVRVCILKLCPFLSPLKSKAKKSPSHQYSHICSPLFTFRFPPLFFRDLGGLSTNVEHGGCNISDRSPGTTSVGGHHDQATKLHTKVFILGGPRWSPQDMSHICPNGVPNQCAWCWWMWRLKVESLGCRF